MKIIEDYKMFTKNGGVGKKICTVFLNPCFHTVVLFRLSHFFYNIHLSLFAKIIWYINRILFNADIDYRAKLEGGLVLIHGLGIVIGKDVISKGPLTIYQGVTIGGSGKSREIDGIKRYQPIIYSNCIIYTNALVLGPILIGENTVIKADSLVIKDMIENE